jgi:lipopolysaccharide export system protein LptA
MMRIFLFLFLFFSFSISQELKIKANYFETNEKSGKTLFKGNVNIKKGYDEINASKVIVFTDKKRNPTKFIAQGNVRFKIETENKNRYIGKAQKIIYLPKKKIYEFYKNVYLKQINDTKEVEGDEVYLNLKDGKAYAKGSFKPVIMIFDVKEEKK